MPDQSIERLTVQSLRVEQEIELVSGAKFYPGGKSQENAQVASLSITLAASATTDGMEATIKCLDAAGVVIPGVRALEVWISESAAGAGLTADSYSGTVTAATGTINTALTAKKHFLLVTAASGIAVLLAVDSANPVDQYVAAKNPDTGKVHVSSASGTNWEGAA